MRQLSPLFLNGAKVTIQSKVGASALTSSEIWFDDFGRVAKQSRKMPDGTWSK